MHTLVSKYDDTNYLIDEISHMIGELVEKQIDDKECTRHNPESVIDVLNRHVQFVCPLIDSANCTLLLNGLGLDIQVKRCAVQGRLDSVCKFPVILLNSYMSSRYMDYIFDIQIHKNGNGCTIKLKMNKMKQFEVL
jgi:hypothetical protein